MSKREAREIAPDGVDVDAPRAKRRREGPAQASSPQRDHGANSDAHRAVKNEGEGAESKKEDPEEVKTRGLSLWQSVKDAVNKEGRVLSHDFLRLPSKRQYPDYYQMIKRPISLDDIKTQIENGWYTTLDDVRQDLETCFKNAKRYNMKDSQIWKDAKHLHKHVIKEYNKMTGADEPAGDYGEGDENNGAGVDGAGGSDDEGGKKKKVPNMNRLLKTRLQKLVEKTDESGRVLATEFMDLPNKKQWPIYYKIIKQPQCLENIFKHLKRKEYRSSQEFANDVELVFSNALEFNQEHTEIWDDALVLRDYFRLIMSDLPAPFAVPAYSNAPEPSTKLKLKVPAPTPGHQSSMTKSNTPASSSHTPANTSISATGTLLLRVPVQPGTASNGAATTKPDAVKSPAPKHRALPTAALPRNVPLSTAPSPTPVPTSSQFVPPPGSTPPVPTGHLQPATFTPSTGYLSTFSNKYSSSPYHVTPSTTSSSLVVPAAHTAQPVGVDQASNVSRSPSVTQSGRQLKRVWLNVKPLGRRLELDYRDGVRTWAVRLGGKETMLQVSRVVFRGDGEDEYGSDDDFDADKQRSQGGEQLMEEEEEEEEEPAEPKIKRRGRGRPSKKDKEREAKLAEAAELEKNSVSKLKKGKARAKDPAGDTVQVVLNGTVVNKSEEIGEGWNVLLPVGSSVVEIGEKGGVVWRVFLDRAASW